MTANPGTVPAGGGNVTIAVADENDGNVPLTGVYFTLTGVPAFTGSPLTMTKTGEIVGNGDAVMDPGEIWTFGNTVFISTDTSFTAVGHGFSGALDITGPAETRTIVVNIPHVPAVSTMSIVLLIVVFAGGITLFAWQRRRHNQISR